MQLQLFQGTDLFAGEGYTEEHKKGEEEKLKEDQQPQASQKSEHVRVRNQNCVQARRESI